MRNIVFGGLHWGPPIWGTSTCIGVSQSIQLHRAGGACSELPNEIAEHAWRYDEDFFSKLPRSLSISNHIAGGSSDSPMVQ